MSNIIFIPPESAAALHPNLKNQLAEAFGKPPPAAADTVHLYVVENHRTYFPQAIKSTPHFAYRDEQRYPAGIQEQVNSFVKEVQKVCEVWTINGTLQKNDSRIYVFLNFKSREEVERRYFQLGSTEDGTAGDKDTPPLNVVPVEPKYRFAQMVLNKEVGGQLESCVTMKKNLDKIYHEWGFDQVDPVKKSVVNFYGPPGTGKTMAGHAVAAELGKKILAINYSDVESKFVGDAPKNLVSVFSIAQREDCILFFDEADSFLGKRVTNVSSSSDQAVNSLRSQMLILLESFPGTVIFATNLNENYDTAFMSRIISSIQFQLPDTELRKRAIGGMIPDKAPMDRGILTDGLLGELAELCDGFSHWEIKNVALAVLTECCQRNACITEDLLREVFTQRKESFAQQQKNSGSSTGQLRRRIAENLKSGNYKVAGQEDEGEANPGIGYEHLSAEFLMRRDMAASKTKDTGGKDE